MGIYLKGNNWYIDYYLRGRRKRKKVGPSKKLAEQVLKDIEVKIAKKEFLDIDEYKRVLFDDYSLEYLQYSKANKSFSTYNRRDRVSLNQLVPFFKGHYLDEISSHMIEKYKSLRLETVQPATVNREVACMKHMFTKASEWGYVKKNPTKGVKLLKEPPGRLRYLDPDEAQALLKACAEHLRPIVVMALNTGMRRSEILSLKWQEVDLQNRKIVVIRSKNNETRVIPMNEMLYQEMDRLHGISHQGYVFSDANGHSYGDIKRSFNSAMKRAKIENFHFHDLRHTFGSHLVMQGVDLRTVQQMLGHKDIKMTMRYSHLSPAHVQDAVKKLDQVWTLFGHQPKNASQEMSTND